VRNKGYATLLLEPAGRLGAAIGPMVDLPHPAVVGPVDVPNLILSGRARERDQLGRRGGNGPDVVKQTLLMARAQKPDAPQLSKLESIAYIEQAQSCQLFDLRIYSGPIVWPAHTRTPRLTSDTAACCWISLFALRSELARAARIFVSLPVALLSPDDTRGSGKVAPLARRAGVKPGMTVSQAIGLCPFVEAVRTDPVHYDEQFRAARRGARHREPGGRAGGAGTGVRGTDGLGRIVRGAGEKIVEAIQVRECGMRNVEFQ